MTRNEKLSYLKDILNNAMFTVQGNKDEWRKFLSFYANIYKYPFIEALLIYEQAPHATACGEIQHWNKVGRRVHRGTKGIPIINDASSATDIRYVFDVSDTYGDERGIPRQMKLTSEDRDAIVSELQKRLDLEFTIGNPDLAFIWAIEEYARDRCEAYLSDLRENAKDSYLASIDDDYLFEGFAYTVIDSVAFLVCERLGVVKNTYDFDVQEYPFMFLNQFDTIDVFSNLGLTVGNVSRNAILLINEIIRDERKKREVTIDDRKGQTYDRGSNGSVSDDSRGDRGDWEQSGDSGNSSDRQIWQNVSPVSRRESPGEIRQPDDGNETQGGMRGSEQGSTGDDGDNSESTISTNSSAGSGRFHGDSEIQDNDQGSGGGSSSERDSLQTQIISSTKETETNLSEESIPGVHASSSNITDELVGVLWDDLIATPQKKKTEQLSLFGLEPTPEPSSENDNFSNQIVETESAPEETAQSQEELDQLLGFDSVKPKPVDVTETIERHEIIEPEIKANNFHIVDEHLGEGGAKTKYALNIDAIRILKLIETERRNASSIEQEKLSRYVGWGGIPQAFDSNNANWTHEYSEVKSLLTPEEYDMARASTLNAHFTSPLVINGMYTAIERMGFKGGNILEPSMGVGNFFGLLPENMGNSRLYGIELDSITGRIAKQLYQKADIKIQGFEVADLPDNFFDMAIGNVPFGSYKLNDSKYNKYGFLIHDYFFAKTIDKVRPGGVIAFITSKGTMDKTNTTVRRYIAERAEFLGAIRLPNTAFKANAGTEVTCDIIFLKKRERFVDAENEQWIFTGKTEDGIPLNEYYLGNPHMMLGTMAFDSSMYGNETETTLNPDARDLNAALLEAIDLLPKNIVEETISFENLETFSTNALPADPTVKNYCYTIMEDGNIYQRVDSRMEQTEFAKSAIPRVKAMIEMRYLTRFILSQELAGCSDDELQSLQHELSEKYDRFYKKYGAINSRYNSSLFDEDSDFPLLSSIEILDENGDTQKSPFFSKRVIAPEKKTFHVETSVEALTVCLDARGYVDIEFMAELTNRSTDEVIEDLRGVIFKNPVNDNFGDENNILLGWETADEYLSGRVKDKLAAAELAANDNQIYSINVEALKSIQPTPLEAHEINVRIGVHWLDSDYYRQFLIETMNPPEWSIYKIQVEFLPQTGEWAVVIPYSRYSVETQQKYGTSRMDAYRLFELTLNQKNPRIYDSIKTDNGVRRVLNREETIAICDRQNRLKEAFANWIFEDPERREQVCALYNEIFNSERSRQYDGSHLTFPGMSPEIKLETHQKAGVARALYGGNSLIAHAVGGGKTYTMAAAGMEMKRLGLAQKPCFVVPNHLVNQWANEFKRLYPMSNVLAATKRDFEKQRRKRFCARIATGEWDAVIIGQSSFGKIPMSYDRLMLKIQREIDEIETAIVESRRKDGKDFTVKNLEKARKSLEFEFKRLQDDPKDDLVTFEELGVDALFVDEAHYYKNKFIYTKMNNVAGVSTTRAKKSTDLDMKCEYINEQNAGMRGVVFATGTPISNSMVELFTMQTYLQREELKRLGLNHFDVWAANFGEVISALELAPSGQGYRIKDRFAKFVNLPELMSLFNKIADIQTSEMLDLPIPSIMGGKPTIIDVDPSLEQRQYTEILVKRSEAISQRIIDPRMDNMLCVTNDGRNAALDMRCIDSQMPDFPDSKVNVCVQKVFDIYHATANNRLTQMIFCDLSTPKSKLIIPMMKDENGVFVIDKKTLEQQNRPFSVYDDIKLKLVELGVQEHEIAFIHDANTDEQKEKMFASVRNGDIRIIIGSTQKMGAGTNAQTRLIALHHLDCPYRPSDLEQRDGRIKRQGNKNPEIQIYRYVTKNSFDAYLWQIVESKQGYISQIMSGKNPSREMEDIDETVLNYAEVKAIATGNPMIRRKMELDLEVQRLRVLESQFRANKYNLENDTLKKLPENLSKLASTIEGLKTDISLRDEHQNDNFYMKIGKNNFTEKKDAGELLLKVVLSGQYADKSIGVYKGFEIIPQSKSLLTDIPEIALKGVLSHRVELSKSDLGCITRIDNSLDRLETKLQDCKRDIIETQQRLEASRLQMKKPFEHESALKEALSELESVNATLDIDKGGDVAAIILDPLEESDQENYKISGEYETEDELEA